MNYKEALDYIYGANRFGPRNGLKNTQKLLMRMGNPQNCFKSIHIAGTNGKGSTAAMLTHILMSQGYRVGMFTSPHLEDFTERIQINLEQIAREDVVRITSMIKEHIDDMIVDGEGHPRGFEIITAIGFQYFAEQGVDYAVVETGLGGRIDATSALTPQLTIITSISHDHMHILGDNIESIAFEKAGIIKPNTPVVMYPQIDEVSKVIKEVASERGAPIYEVDDAKIDIVYSKFGKQVFDFKYGNYRLERITIHLTGKHQIWNAATALMGVMILRKAGVEIYEKAVLEGLATTKWPGRLERLATSPDIVVDGAHNIASARALADSVEEYYSGRHIILIIGILKDKQVDSILEILCRLADTIIVTRPDSDRAVDTETLFQKVNDYSSDIMILDDASAAMAKAIDIAHPSDVIIVSGSLYLIGEVRKILKHECLP